MVKKHVYTVFLFTLALVTFGPPPAGAQGQGRGRPKFEFEESPLVTAIQQAAAQIEFKNLNSPKCRAAMESGDQDQIDKFCKGPAKAKDSKEKMSKGKAVGRRIVSETDLYYMSPRDRGRSRDTWDRVMIDAATLGAIGADFNSGAASGRLRRAVLFPDQAVNDDRDCVDTLTGERLGGWVAPDDPMADGEPASCFTASSELKRTLTHDPSDRTGCEHTSAGGGESRGFLPADPDDGVEDVCYTENGIEKTTTLEELVDEDGPDGDNDGDGAVDEDPEGDADGDGDPNDDGDCLDLVTGEALGGPRLAVGDTDPCFDAAGELRATLFHDPDATDGCEHLPSGTLLPGAPGDGVDDACYDAEGNPKTTSLAELVDEDDAVAINQDGDCYPDDDPAVCDPILDEDPPTDFATACRALYADLGLVADPMEPGAPCDLTRALVVKANRDKAEEVAQSQNKNKFKGGKFFQADDEGRPLAEVEGGVAIGREEREVTVTETVDLTCAEGRVLIEELNDSGEVTFRQCVEEAAAEVASLAEVFDPTTGAAAAGTASRLAMMGFTFAPPALEWEEKIKEKACAFGVCAEVFFARVSYEFSTGLGLRLPVEIHAPGLPALEADPPLAGEAISIQTQLEPLNFLAEDYKSYCQDNGLANGTTIADCDRFSFPNFLEKLPLDLIGESDLAGDGDEFVARVTAEAGVEVRTFGIPLIDWSLRIDLDLAEMCTYLILKDSPQDLAAFIAANGGDVRKALQDLGVNCGSFTTPFGEEADPTSPIPGVTRLRTFPFLNLGLEVRADCAEALVRGEVITIGGRTFVRCTGLVMGAHGASLGVGLGIDVSAGSDRIEADWSPSGDANPEAGAEIAWNYSDNQPESENDPEAVIGPVMVDNWDDRPNAGQPAVVADDAVFSMGDFTYLLNALNIKLSAQLQFGGILSPIPNLPSLTLYNYVLRAPDGTGIPIDQHPGTADPRIEVFVENYGLETVVSPRCQEIQPGTFGTYEVAVNHLGSQPGGFDNFRVELSNAAASPASTEGPCADPPPAPGDEEPLVFDEDNDGDGAENEDDFGNADGIDGLLCVDPDGGPDRDDDDDGRCDEDPPDDWATTPSATDFNTLTIADVPAHSLSRDGGTPGFLTLAVRPFQHFTTAPGLYPVRLTADSVEAKSEVLPEEFEVGERCSPTGMGKRDPVGNLRCDAKDVVFIEVAAFFDPQIAITPLDPAAKPGVIHTLTVEGFNGGNVEDEFTRETEFVDFNTAGCTLVTLGSLPDGCPYRAVPTAIPDDEWSTIAGLPDSYGPLEPGGFTQDTFIILVPRDWAGMTDTTYTFVSTVESQVDETLPPASFERESRIMVIATMESMTRYIGLEIRALIEEIEAANAAGIRTGGLLPISLHPAERKNDRALDLILAGDLERASGVHRSNIHVMEAFLHALDGFNGKGNKIPAELDADWRARAHAILADQAVAADSLIPSAPLAAAD